MNVLMFMPIPCDIYYNSMVVQLEFGNDETPAVPSLLRVVLAILVCCCCCCFCFVLFFHVKLGTVLSIVLELIGIALNLSIASGKVTLLLC